MRALRRDDALLAALLLINTSCASGLALLPTSRRRAGACRAAPDDVDDFDFEAAYKARVAEEGGELGLKVGGAKRAAKSAAASAAESAKESSRKVASALDLRMPKRSSEPAAKGSYADLMDEQDQLTAAGWNTTVGLLGLIVVFAFVTQMRIDPAMW